MKKLLILLLVLSGCVSERMVDEPSGAKETINLAINVPSSGSGTRAFANESGEQDVTDVDVFQFDPVTGKFAFRSVGAGFAGMADVHTFSAKMLVGDWDLVFIVNARDAVNSAIGNIDENTSMQDAMNLISMTIPATGKISNTIVKQLPMFGVKLDENVDKGVRIDVDVVRSVAKIDVTLASAVIPNFQIAEVRLYNQPLQGWVAPEIASWPVATYDPATMTDVYTTPWYGGNAAPARSTYVDAATPGSVIYTAAAGDNVTASAVTNSIYTWEAPAGSKADYQNNVCIVIGGYYKGSTTMSYYRADMRANPTDVNYLPIRRNHNYQVNITGMSDAGHDNPDDAFHGIPRVTATVSDWVLAPHDVIFDGEYYLKVSSDQIAMFDNGFPVNFTVETNYNISNRGYPAGIQITYPTGTANSWMTVTSDSGVNGNNGALTRTVTLTGLSNDAVISGSGSARNYDIKITAGNLTKTVRVTQEPHFYGFKAVYGTIGYIWHPGYPDHKRLTILGDKDYYQNWVQGLDEEFQSRQDTSRVYMAYFKVGVSLIACSTQRHFTNPNATNADIPQPNGTYFNYNKDIIEYPREWVRNQAALDAVFAGVIPRYDQTKQLPKRVDAYPTLTDSYSEIDVYSVYPPKPEFAWGDPCKYYDKAYFGNLGWRLPTHSDGSVLTGGGITAPVGGGAYDFYSPATVTVSDLPRLVFHNAPAGQKACPMVTYASLFGGYVALPDPINWEGDYMTSIGTNGSSGITYWPFRAYDNYLQFRQNGFGGEGVFMGVRCVGVQ